MNLYYSDNISWQLLDNKVYVIDEITKKIYILDRVGKDFWMLVKNNSFEETVIILSKKYNVSLDIIIKDLDEFKDNLLSSKLLIKGDNYNE